MMMMPKEERKSGNALAMKEMKKKKKKQNTREKVWETNTKQARKKMKVPMYGAHLRQKHKLNS